MFPELHGTGSQGDGEEEYSTLKQAKVKHNWATDSHTNNNDEWDGKHHDLLDGSKLVMPYQKEGRGLTVVFSTAVHMLNSGLFFIKTMRWSLTLETMGSMIKLMNSFEIPLVLENSSIELTSDSAVCTTIKAAIMKRAMDPHSVSCGCTSSSCTVSDR